MLENLIENLIKQFPNYQIFGNYIKGIDNNYWLIFKHHEADKFSILQNMVKFLGFETEPNYKIFRIDLKYAKIFNYTLKKDNDFPNNTLLRTSNLQIIEQFLKLENVTQIPGLNLGNFDDVKIKRQRRFNLPPQLTEYNEFISEYLKRTKIYRRSTAYFNSGVLKLYQEPLSYLIENQGEIRLLMDWAGFTNKRDVEELEKLYNPQSREEYINRTLTEFLQGLKDDVFSSTIILAELVKFKVLTIRMIKMSEGQGIYHRKTGILTDNLGNSIVHEGSDNFTLSAHSRNSESVMFFYYSDSIDLETIQQIITEFDAEWNNSELGFDLSQQFLHKILEEKQRREELRQQNQPKIEKITPDEIPSGQTTLIEIMGENLGDIDSVEIPDNPLITINIEKKEPELLTGNITVDIDHPPTSINNIVVREKRGKYQVKPKKPAKIKHELTLPEWSEIKGFKEAIELILQGKQGKPDDFLYWLAQQIPHIVNIKSSNILDDLLNDKILFEHQKSGAQHCLAKMKQFGVSVCADAVGLGKTRLAATVAKLYLEEKPQGKIAIIAAKKLHSNWEREMRELGFKQGDYELYNKNLMSSKNSKFVDDFNRYGGADLVIIDEVHEGIRNYNNRIHKTCLEIQTKDILNKRQRYYLLLTATPWNNRREDIYNILSPFLNRTEGFIEVGLPVEVKQWFENRNIGIENFIDNTNIFRKTYKELFLQRTRKMLKKDRSDLQLYAQRVAEWLPIEFELETEQALEQIFTQFENSLFIPFADPIRYFKENVEQRSLLKNQRRMFLQRSESSMYSLRMTIENFISRIETLQERLNNVSDDLDGLEDFLLEHYNLKPQKKNKKIDSDMDEEEEEEEEETPEEKRQKIRTAINTVIKDMGNKPEEIVKIKKRILADCDSDLEQLKFIAELLANEFVTDHKRKIVTEKVRELVLQGRKVLLISTFSDTVIDYYEYMAKDEIISGQGVGMSIGATKYYFSGENKEIEVMPNNIFKGKKQKKGLKREEIFRLFAPEANCKNQNDRPNSESEIGVLIGSETLSVGQNLQDADYLINIDLPWNPMILEQRIGRIDRPKSHFCENIYIYYANSESQLLRQASRLNNLHKKLIGDLEKKSEIPNINNLEDLGASIYGDTLFDDEILPGYIEFLNSLVKARKVVQESFQEKVYQNQKNTVDYYSENEILHSEELRKLYERLGDNYEVNPITIGQDNFNQEMSLVGIKIDYFDPNGKLIKERQEKIYWNSKSGDEEGIGKLIDMGFKTPEKSEIISTKGVIKRANTLYDKLVELKGKFSKDLEQWEWGENQAEKSERFNRIQKRLNQIKVFPKDINTGDVRKMLKKLTQGKGMKKVQKILFNYTDGVQSKLNDAEFIIELIKDVERLNLINFDNSYAASLSFSLEAMLLII